MPNHLFRVAIRVAVVIVLILGFSSTPGVADDPPAAVETGADGGAEETMGQAELEVNEAREAAISEFNLGVGALDVEDLPAALEHFRQASKVDPDFADAAKATAAVAMELEDFETAADAAENLVRLQPDSVDAIGTAYFAELLLGDAECTKKALGTFIELAPNDADAEVARSLLEYVK